MKPFTHFLAEANNNKKVTPALRNKYSSAAKRSGLDGNGRFPSISKALHAVGDALNTIDMHIAQLIIGDEHLGPNGTLRLKLSFNDSDFYVPNLLIFSW